MPSKLVDMHGRQIGKRYGKGEKMHHIKGGAMPDKMSNILVKCKDKPNVMVGIDKDEGLIKIIKEGRVKFKIPIKAKEQIKMEICRAFGFDDYKVDQLRPNAVMMILKV
jgi:hypothetical protein